MAEWKKIPRILNNDMAGIECPKISAPEVAGVIGNRSNGLERQKAMVAIGSKSNSRDERIS